MEKPHPRHGVELSRQATSGLGAGTIASGGVHGARPHRLSNVLAIHDHGRMDDKEASVRAENAELRRLLQKHQWAGLTPFKSDGCCPECTGPAPPRGSGHRPGCAIAAILVISTPLPNDL
jgi:hypothetical protein